MTTPSLTALRNITKKIAFNPKKDKILGIVSSQGSPDYYEHEAIVQIHRAQEIRESSPEQYEQTIIAALRALTLALYYGGPDGSRQPPKDR